MLQEGLTSDDVLWFWVGLFITAYIKCFPLTGDGKDEGRYGDDPGHSTVALSKLFHEVMEKDTQALEDPVGADLHYKEGHGHSPTPTTFRHLRVDIWTQTPSETGWPHGCRSWSPVGSNRHMPRSFMSRKLFIQKFWFKTAHILQLL